MEIEHIIEAFYP